MPTITNNLLQNLRTFWAKDPNATDQSDAKIKAALERLLSLPGVKFREPLDLTEVILALSTFQRTTAGVTGNPGILTNGLVDFIMNRLQVMDTTADPTTDETLEHKPITTSNRAFWVRYYVDTDSFESFADPNDVIRMLKDAWLMWVKNTRNLLVRKVASPGTGIVTVRGKGVAGGVGLANVLGPGKFNGSGLFVDLDIAEINTPDAEFTAIAAHEFGHIIGIGHQAEGGHLMSAVVPHGLTQPTAKDIAVAQQIYGKPKPTPDPLPLNGGVGFDPV